MNDFEAQLSQFSDRVLSKSLTEDEQSNYTESLFESLKHVNEYGQEFWYARDLQDVLEYKRWDKFCNVISKAKNLCQNSGNRVADHFSQVGRMVNIGSGAEREIDDFELCRYACYLMVQNGDSRKKIIALGQTYFAIKTRQNKKGLKKSQNILDHMGSTELAANLFRATQTDEKLRNDNVTGKTEANDTHFEVGRKVRQTIVELGGTMPEDLPTPPKSIKQIQKEQKKLE